MRNLNRFEYIFVSLPLVLLSFGLPALFATFLNSEWAAFATGLPFYLALMVLTFFQLRGRQFSALWILPMLINFHFGPSWQIGELRFHASGLISILPVVLMWMLSTDRSSTRAPNPGDIA